MLPKLCYIGFSIGNFTMTKNVNLPANQLTVFEEGVFKEMLQQMMSVQFPIGRVHLNESKLFNTFVTITSSNISLAYFLINSDPFVCGCDIAWLIRDNRHLLPAVQWGKCADDSRFPSVYFEELDSRFFTFCP